MAGGVRARNYCPSKGGFGTPFLPPLPPTHGWKRRAPSVGVSAFIRQGRGTPWPRWACIVGDATASLRAVRAIFCGLDQQRLDLEGTEAEGNLDVALCPGGRLETTGHVLYDVRRQHSRPRR
jgi:hypothetical protein